MKCVYACITDKCMRTLDEVKKTRKYKKAEEVAAALHIDNIVIDICSSWNRKKSNLESILSSEENIIIVSDITSLGKNDEISTVYQRILDTNNEILICYFDNSGILKADEMSTVSLSYKKKSEAITSDLLEMSNLMSSTQYRKNSSRMLDPRIIDGYWEIEKGGRSQREIVEDIGTSKNTFIRRIDEYVGTGGWIDRYEVELETSNIKDLPTKLGEVSDDAKRLYEYLKEHPEERPDGEAKYDIQTVVRFAGIYTEISERLEEIAEDESKLEEHKYLTKKFYVLAHHLYRQVLRYEKYLKRLKYRQ